MYPLTPMKVYMLDRVQDDFRCVARMERMLKAIGMGPGDVTCITEKNLPDVVTELRSLWPPDSVPEGMIRTYMRPLVFTTMELKEPGPDLKPLLERCPQGTPMGFLDNIYGHLTKAVDQHPHDNDQKLNYVRFAHRRLRLTVCWPTYNFGTVVGCSHGCLYCGNGRSGKFIAITLNLEDYIEQVVGPTIEKYRWNKVFRMILSGADLITLEPEYGLHELFTRKLAQYEGRYGHFHTGSSNVDWIAHLPYRARLVGVWSTTCEAVARDIEPGAGSAVGRFEAGRKCQDMGVPARYKFKPVIPIRNWREEYAKALEQALTISKPESIGFCLYIWNTYDSLVKSINPDLLDQEYLDEAYKAKEQMKDLKSGPFPHHVRAEIYKFLIKEARRWDKDVLLYLSTETREMWDELKDEIGQDPRAFFCGCGSVALPGRKLGLSHELRYSTYCPAPSCSVERAV